MPHKLLDQFGPFLHRARRADISPVEAELLRSARQRLRHETQFDEGLHATVQQAIIDGVDVLEIAVRAHAHFIIENSVKTHAFKTGFVLEAFEILAPGLSHRDRRTIRSHDA